MGLKGKIEAVIYAAEEPIALEQIALLVKEPVLQELAAEQARAAEVAASEQSAAELSAGAQVESEPAGEPSSLEAASVEKAGGSADADDEVGERSAEPAAMDESNEAGGVQGDSAPAPADGAEVATADIGESVAGDVAAADERPAGQGEQDPAAPAVETQAQSPTEASKNAPAAVLPKRRAKAEVPPEVKARVRSVIEELMLDYANGDRGMEIRQVAGGYRMATKPEHHDIIKAFVKSLKPPLRLSMPALETLAVVAYKQPVTAPEVSEIRGVDSQGVLATLLDRKLVTTAGRKAVIGRPILYKTTKDFLMRFGLRDVAELPSMEEFEKMAQEAGTVEMFQMDEAPEETEGESVAEDTAESGPVEVSSADVSAEVDAESSAQGEGESGANASGESVK